MISKYHGLAGGLQIAFGASYLFEESKARTEAPKKIRAWETKMGGNNMTHLGADNSAGQVKAVLYLPLQNSFRAGDGAIVREFFVPYDADESYFELSIGRPASMSEKISVVAFRRKRELVRDGKTETVDGMPFGFDASPSPQNVIVLREYRPDNNPDWSGFEPLFLKIREDGRDIYYKVEVEWRTAIAEREVAAVVARRNPDDLPDELKNFSFKS